MAKATEKSKTGYVTIATVRSRDDARRMTTKLESAGIECSIVDEKSSMIGGLGRLRFGGIKVQVERSNVTRAVQLLRDKTNDDGSKLQHNAFVRHPFRMRLGLNGWQRAAIEIAVIVAVAVLLAAWLF
jgi:hypothetical protein